MKKDREFARRIKAVYEKQGAVTGDLRPVELATMFDLFLGKTYDQQKRGEIARVQEDLHKKQESLANRFGAGGMNPEDYLSSLNSLIGDGFAECRRILGPKDFTRLFGAPYADEVDFVDRTAFLESTASKQTTQPYVEDYGFLRMTNREVRGVVIVDLDGRIVLGEATQALREGVKELLAAGKKRIVLNLQDIDYIDSAGIGALVSTFLTARSQNASLKLFNLGSEFQEALQVTKLLRTFDIYDSEQAAVRSFHK